MTEIDQKLEQEAERLQRYFDGELSESEAIAFEHELAESEEKQHQLMAFERIGDLVRLGAEDDAKYAKIFDDADIFSKIEAEIEAPTGPSIVEETRNIPSVPPIFDSSDPTHPRVVHIEAARRRRRLFTAGAVVAAAAAVVLIVNPFATPPKSTHVAHHDLVIEESHIEIHDKPIEVAAAHHGTAHNGSAVEEYDFGPNTGTIFQVEGELGQPIAVVWIDEDEGEIL